MEIKIVEGTAIQYLPRTHELFVKLENDSIGIVREDHLTIYSDFSVQPDNYCRAASYCVGIKLKYVVIGQENDKLILSRKLLAEETLSQLKNERVHNYVIGTITGVEEKNVFIDVDGVYGICPASDLAYAYLPDCGAVFERGERFEFSISLVKDDKLLLSRVETLPPKDMLLEAYPTQTTIIGRLLTPAFHTTSSNFQPWFFINKEALLSNTPDAKSISGIVQIPLEQNVHPGNDVRITLTHLSHRAGQPIGLWGYFDGCCKHAENKMTDIKLPALESLKEAYPENSIITGQLLCPVNPKLDSPDYKSWFFINKDRAFKTDEPLIPGIVEIPASAYTRPGMEVGIVITRASPRGLRGNMTVR